MSTTVFEKQQEATILEQHLAKVRSDYESGDFTLLELKLKHEELMDVHGDPDVSNMTKELAKHEAAVVAGLIQENTPAIPTPAAYLEQLREKGEYVAAEALEHQLKVDAANQAVADAQVAMQEAVDAGWGEDAFGYKERQQKLADATQVAAEINMTSPPIFQRAADAKAHEATANTLFSAAGAIDDLPDGTVQGTASEMFSRAQENADAATALRNHVPFPTGGDAA